MVGREIITGLFIHHDDIILHLCRETIGQAVIIHTENKTVITPERECHFIIDILHFCFFINRRRNHFIDCRFQHFRNFGVCPQDDSILQCHGYRRGGKHFGPIVCKRKTDIVAYRNNCLQFFVRRLQLIVFLCRQRHASHQEECNKSFYFHGFQILLLCNKYTGFTNK